MNLVFRIPVDIGAVKGQIYFQFSVIAFPDIQNFTRDPGIDALFLHQFGRDCDPIIGIQQPIIRKELPDFIFRRRNQIPESAGEQNPTRFELIV